MDRPRADKKDLNRDKGDSPAPFEGAGRSFRPGFLALLLIPLGMVLWQGALSGAFVLDDRAYIVENPAIRSLAALLDLGAVRYAADLSFAINYRIGGLTPFDFHLVNVLIHIANSIVIFFLVTVTFETPVFACMDKGRRRAAGLTREAAALGTAALASVVFLVHPLHTQAVTYVTQRYSSLAALFYLLAVLLYAAARVSAPDKKIEGRSAWALYLCSMVCAVLAMKTKEISFTLPFIIALYEFVFFRSTGGAGGTLALRLRRLAPFFLTLLIIPVSLLGPELGLGAGTGLDEELRQLKLLEAATIPGDVYIYTQFRVIMTYLRLLVFPAGQRFFYDYPIYETLFLPAPLLSLLFLVSLVGLASVLLARSFSRAEPFGAVFSFGVFWFFICLSVESFMVPIKDVIFEHRAYLPSVGLIVSAASMPAALFYHVKRRPFKRAAYVSALCLVLALVAVPLAVALDLRNRLWADEMALLDDELEKSPGSAPVYFARGVAYLDRALYAEAIEANTRAIAISPGFGRAYANRGYAYAVVGMYDESIRDFTRAIVLEPWYYGGYHNRARSLARVHRYDEALVDFTRALELRPGFLKALNDRGLLLALTGDPDAARRDLAAACEGGFRASCDNLDTLGK